MSDRMSEANARKNVRTKCHKEGQIECHKRMPGRRTDRMSEANAREKDR